MKFAVISGFAGRIQDRFCTYHEPKTLREKIATIASVPGINGIEAIYPHDFSDRGLLKEALAEFGMGVSAVNLNLKSDPCYHRGSLTSESPETRRRAVGDVKAAMEAAREIGASRISACLLADGHDYPFEVDYAKHWNWLVEGVREGAADAKDITLSIEYKLAETRARTVVGTAYKAMLLAKDTGLPNVGVTIDVGHAIWAIETPAQSLAMLAEHKIPFYVHLNDNYGDWDWDMMPGSVNPLSLIEFFHYLKRYGYEDWLTFDVFPSRMDAADCFDQSMKFVDFLRTAADRISEEDLIELRAVEDVPAIMGLLRQAAYRS